MEKFIQTNNSNLLLLILLRDSIQGASFGIKLQILQCKNNSLELWSFVFCIVLQSWILQINKCMWLLKLIYIHTKVKVNLQY